MRFTRRKALASIGAVGIGGSAVFGSGAFTQTAVDREFDLQIAADDNALLSLTTGPEDYDAIEAEAVTDDGRDLLQFDFTDESMDGGVNNQADTAFGDAFTVENNTSDSVFIWLPTAQETAPVSTLLSSANRSTEFVVDDPNGGSVVGGKNRENNNVTSDEEAVDLSFPPKIAKHPDDVEENTNLTGEFNDVSDDDYSGADDQSRAFGMTPGGAVEIGSGNSVDVGIRFLIRGSRDAGSTDQVVVRFQAERLEESEVDNEKWISDFSRVEDGQTR